jgi:hypothetical protein
VVRGTGRTPLDEGVPPPTPNATTTVEEEIEE